MPKVHKLPPKSTMPHRQIAMAIEAIVNARLQKKSAAISEQAAKGYLLSLNLSFFEDKLHTCEIKEVPFRKLDIQKLEAYLQDELEQFYVWDTKTIFQISSKG